jgi:NAD(P)H-flavin reductase
VDAENKPWSRPYTPVTGNEELGYVDVVIKLYPLGKMSQHLKKLEPGQSIEIRGPIGHLHYKQKGNMSILRKAGITTEHNVKHIGMICGGTGKNIFYYIFLFGSFFLFMYLY